MRPADVALVLVGVLGAVALSCAAPRDPEVSHFALRGARAPELALLGVDDRPVSLRAHRGDVVVVAFFATWCEPCKKTMPALEALRAKYAARRVEVLGVSLDDAPDGLSSYAAAYGVTFPIGWDSGQEAVRPWFVRNLPAEFVVDRGGVVQAAFIGYADGVEVEIERELLRLL
jgi:peroxiredoxin